MAMARIPSSKRSPAHSSSKIGQRKALIKKKVSCRRPTGLKCNKIKKEALEAPTKSIVRNEMVVATKSAPYACPGANSSVMERALEVQANLTPQFPSFLKSMLPSHVAGGFWLSFPKRFCDSHLPKHDDTVVLVDESEKEYATKYLFDKNGLSGGWRGFSIAHKLLEGDVLTFQLIKPCKFKVYIIRANNLSEIDGAIGLLTLDAHSKAMEIDHQEGMQTCETAAAEKCLGTVMLDIHQDDPQGQGLMMLNTDLAPTTDQSRNYSDDNSSEVLDGIRISESAVDFKDLKCIGDFNIHVDGLIIDSLMPTHLRTKYYDLCRSQKSFLHDHLLEGLNFKLVCGIISETVNIADAIRASKLSTSHKSFETWDKTLKAFEDMGMKVGFMRARLNKLIRLSCEKKKLMESTISERVQTEDDIKALEEKLLNMREKIKSLDAEIDAMKVEVEGLDLVFRKEANSPW